MTVATNGAPHVGERGGVSRVFVEDEPKPHGCHSCKSRAE
jgi:hypothetical protein